MEVALTTSAARSLYATLGHCTITIQVQNGKLTLSDVRMTFKPNADRNAG